MHGSPLGARTGDPAPPDPADPRHIVRARHAGRRSAARSGADPPRRAPRSVARGGARGVRADARRGAPPARRRPRARGPAADRDRGSTCAMSGNPTSCRSRSPASRREEWAALVPAFHAEHASRFGHSDPKAPVEIVSFGVTATGLIDTPELPRPPQGAAEPPEEARSGSRRAYFEAGADGRGRLGRVPGLAARGAACRQPDRRAGDCRGDFGDDGALSGRPRPCRCGRQPDCRSRRINQGEKAMSEAEPIQFWFSIGSTYTYLSVMRLEAAEREYGVAFDWQPFNLRAIITEIGNIPFQGKPPKLAYMWADIERRAAMYGIPAQSARALSAARSLELANRVAIVGRAEGWCCRLCPRNLSAMVSAGAGAGSRTEPVGQSARDRAGTGSRSASGAARRNAHRRWTRQRARAREPRDFRFAELCDARCSFSGATTGWKTR